MAAGSCVVWCSPMENMRWIQHKKGLVNMVKW